MAFTTAINRHLRSDIGVQTEREYLLLSDEVNEAWRNDAPEDFFTPPEGATDDFRYGMSLNPHMQAFITNGRYDLVTPYYATDRLRKVVEPPAPVGPVDVFLLDLRRPDRADCRRRLDAEDQDQQRGHEGSTAHARHADEHADS